jgi:hypothetical protein
MACRPARLISTNVGCSHAFVGFLSFAPHAACAETCVAPFACAALGPVTLAAHTIVKQIVDFAMAIFGTFSTVAQSLIATCLGKVPALPPLLRQSCCAASHACCPAYMLSQSTRAHCSIPYMH